MPHSAKESSHPEVKSRFENTVYTYYYILYYIISIFYHYTSICGLIPHYQLGMKYLREEVLGLLQNIQDTANQ